MKITLEEPAHLYRYNEQEWRDAFARNGFKLDRTWTHNYNLNEFCGIASIS